MLSIYQWHYFSTNMNIALSTSKIVICYSPQTQQSAFRSFASQKRTTTHSTVYTITNGLPFHRITTPRQLQRAFPFTNYNTSSLSTPTTKQSIPFSLFTLHRPFRTLDICPFATVCFRTDQIFTSPHPLLLQPFPALSVSAFCLFSTPYARADANSRANKSHTTRLDTKFPYWTRPCPRKRHRKVLFTWRSFPPTSDNPASLLPSRHPTRPICAHPPHILSPASHTITHLTSLSPLPPPKSPPSSHFTGTQQDVTHLLFRGRKRVRVASYVSIGRSPLHFQHPPPHYTSITLLELAIYFCPLRERTHYPLRPGIYQLPNEAQLAPGFAETWPYVTWIITTHMTLVWLALASLQTRSRMSGNASIEARSTVVHAIRCKTVSLPAGVDHNCQAQGQNCPILLRNETRRANYTCYLDHVRNYWYQSDYTINH